MGVLHQIKTIADIERVTITAIEGMIGASRGVLSRALRNDTDISSMWITKIVENYPHYNCRWILTGSGDMLNDGSTVTPQIIAKQNNANNENCVFCIEKEKLIANQAERIHELKETISILREK